MYKLFLCLRYLFKRRIAIFAMLAVCLCVAMVLTVMSVMGGFLDMVRDRSRGMLGDLVVEGGTLQGFPFYEEFIQRVKTEMPDEIVEATPVIITYGVLRFPSSGMTKPVQVVGIKLEETYRVNDFKNGLFYEKYYPGTTTFKPQAEPHLGFTPEGVLSLPPELEAARKQWDAAASPKDVGEAWRPQRLVHETDARDLPDGLNRGEMTPALSRMFDEEMHATLDHPEVRVVEKGKKWLVGHDRGLVTIEREGDKLKVFTGLYGGPGAFAHPPDDDFEKGPGWQGKPLPGAILGTDLCADRLKTGGYSRYCSRGETLALAVVPFSDKTGFEEGTGMEKLPLRYVDDCRTGVYDIDSMSVYVDFDMLQRNVNMVAYVPHDEELKDPSAPSSQAAASQPAGAEVPARTTQVQIKLNPRINTRSKVYATRDKVREIWDQVSKQRLAALKDSPEALSRISGAAEWVKVQTWEEKQARYIGAVEKEKYLVTILFALISVVAVFLVGVIFHMIVQQKTRDIGIIKSVGATSMGVAGIFLSYAAAVGIVGGAAGTFLGATIVWFINDIQASLIWLFGPSAQVWNPEVYAFDTIPNRVDPWEAAAIYGIAIAASVVGSLIAAWKASRVWPVESLRYE
jgi:ABC-type lipoprotein release transport system permease subunit